jgi:hypothetical protein
MAGNKAKAAMGKSQSATGHRRKTNRKIRIHRKPTRTRRSKARRQRQRSNNDGWRVTTFPQAKGRVVREVRFSHHDLENVLAIAFKDRTVLVFDVDPEPLVLPVDIRAHYIGENPEATKTWERLAVDKKNRNQN